jgi:hypothetical protein
VSAATAAAAHICEGSVAARGESYSDGLTTTTATATATDSAVVGYANSRRNRKRQSTGSASSSGRCGAGTNTTSAAHASNSAIVDEFNSARKATADCKGSSSSTVTADEYTTINSCNNFGGLVPPSIYGQCAKVGVGLVGGNSKCKLVGLSITLRH